MNLGPTELLIILVVILVLFGGAKLPQLARSLGQAQKEFKAAVAELVKVAGDGQAALGGALKNVGASCGGCHKPFREPKT